MREVDVEIVVQRARERLPEALPLISDNRPQCIARDFMSSLRITGMTHARTSPNYPRSNGKLERYHRTIESDAIRVDRRVPGEDGSQDVVNPRLGFAWASATGSSACSPPGTPLGSGNCRLNLSRRRADRTRVAPRPVLIWLACGRRWSDARPGRPRRAGPGRVRRGSRPCLPGAAAERLVRGI